MSELRKSDRKNDTVTMGRPTTGVRGLDAVL